MVRLCEKKNSFSYVSGCRVWRAKREEIVVIFFFFSPPLHSSGFWTSVRFQHHPVLSFIDNLIIPVCDLMMPSCPLPPSMISNRPLLPRHLSDPLASLRLPRCAILSVQQDTFISILLILLSQGHSIVTRVVYTPFPRPSRPSLSAAVLTHAQRPYKFYGAEYTAAPDPGTQLGLAAANKVLTAGVIHRQVMANYSDQGLIFRCCIHDDEPIHLHPTVRLIQWTEGHYSGFRQ